MPEQMAIADERGAGRALPLWLSVVIPNHNYAEFVGQAIESALALDWPRVEVIVVDDGSTDGSRAVIGRYARQVTTILQANAGQKAACNAGFARSRGDVVIFLDSDDLLDPSLPSELMRVWQPGVSKVQFQMQIVDADGRPTGALLPQFGVMPSAQKIRQWALSAGSYPTPPGSGNAYARPFLDRIFPLEGKEAACDSYCLSAAPYLGDVVTVAKPLVSYRVHGRNMGAMSELQVTRFGREWSRARWRFEYAQRIARAAGLRVDEAAFDRNLGALAYRLASLRLAPREHPIARDTLSAVVHDFAAAFSVDQGLTLEARSALLAWAALVAVAPHKLAERLVLWRFASSRRPAALRRLLRMLKVLSSPSA